MRHGIAHRKLGRNPGHRKALLRNMMNALVRSERIETTVAKAKEVRRLADRLITLGKKNSTHARRRTFSLLSDKRNTEKIFATLATRFAGREGGYTRIVRTGYRAGDGSEMAILEYLPAEEKATKAKKGKKKRKAIIGKAKPETEAAAVAKPPKKTKKATARKTAPPREQKERSEGAKGKPVRKRGKKEEPE
ncbi:MAG TPA: 50S ribosomal protein L17 [Candidatus Limnocylindria bacterium]|nr:50S ribosomal protein L17 [Candidatus Limnocylindria bacterium]